MQKKRLFVLLTLTFVIFAITNISFSNSLEVTLLVDQTNDVQYFLDGNYQKKGDYQDEVDIAGIMLFDDNLTLYLADDPVIDDEKHFYQVKVYWDIEGSNINTTVIEVGKLAGENYKDNVTTHFVDSDGNPLNEFDHIYNDTTVILTNRLSWALNTTFISHVETPAAVNATAIYRSIESDGTIEYKDIADSNAPTPIFSTENILPLVGSVFVCGFAGYTLGSIVVYYLTTNIRSKEKNAIFMAVSTFVLAIVVNWLFWVTPWQILWNGVIYLLTIVFGYLWAIRGILKLEFDTPLPDALPIETDEDCNAVIILAKGEGEEYNPLPLIRKYHKNQETGVKQKSALLQPFEYYNVKRKYNKIIDDQKELTSEDIKTNQGKNPYKKIYKNIVSKLEESFLDVDFYQEAFVEDWPTINQALLRTISLGASNITILNLLVTDSYEYQLALKELETIDYSKINITIKQTDFLYQSKEIQKLVADKIINVIPENKDKTSIGVILIGDGQPIEWDEYYPTMAQETAFRDEIKKLLVKSGFSKQMIINAWIENRDSTIQDAFKQLLENNCKTIIYVAATTPISCLNSLIEIPESVKLYKDDKNLDLIYLDAWNTDDDFIKIYLNLITKASSLSLEDLGKNARIVLQSTQIGAKLEPSLHDEELDEEPEKK